MKKQGLLRNKSFFAAPFSFLGNRQGQKGSRKNKDYPYPAAGIAKPKNGDRGMGTKSSMEGKASFISFSYPLNGLIL
mgnify:CR=1 FL=1